MGIGVQGALWLFKLDPLAPKNRNGHFMYKYYTGTCVFR